MTPHEQARAIWEAENPGRNWKAFLRLYSKRPRILIDRPDLFAAMRPVPWWGMTEVDKRYPWTACDTWFVYLLAGKLSLIWEADIPPLPNVCYKRAKNQILHLHRVSRIRILSNGRKIQL